MASNNTYAESQNPWGLWIWAPTTTSYLSCDFRYIKVTVMLDQKNNILVIAANVILNLCKTIPSNQHHKVYADNYFTSIPLFEELQKRRTFFVGTVRNKRMKGCMLKIEKFIHKDGVVNVTTKQKSTTI